MIYRTFLLLVGGLSALLASPLFAQERSGAPFTMDKQYTAELEIMMKDGTTIRGKTFIDGDKMRSEMTNSGQDTVIIIRKDLQKIYTVLDAQKLVMEMHYDPAKFKGSSEAAFGPDGTFELLGIEKSDGIDCLKYKVTSDKDKQVCFFFLDMTQKVPVRMEAADHAYILKWRKYTVGPVDQSLFNPPSDYQVMPMPDVPGATGN